MIPAAVRENACRGLRSAMVEEVDIHPQVLPLAKKICTDCELTGDELVQLAMFHSEFNGDGDRRDELRHLQLGGAEGRDWMFPVEHPEPVEHPGGDDAGPDMAEVTQPRLDSLISRLNSINVDLRARIDSLLAVTLTIAADKVGVQLARAGTKKSRLPDQARTLHEELGNSLAFLQALPPEQSGLIRSWAVAQLDRSEEEIALNEISKLPALVLPAFSDASDEIIGAIAEELDIDEASVRDRLGPVHSENRIRVGEIMAALLPAMVLQRLGRASDGDTVRSGIDKGLVDDLLRVGGGADFTAAGGVPYVQGGGRFENGVEMTGDLFATSDNVLDTIEAIEGTRPAYNATYVHQGNRRGKKSNKLHARQHGKTRGEAEVSPGEKRGCECEWNTTLNAAGVCRECGQPKGVSDADSGATSSNVL